jgi:hypothetical protein
VNNSFCLKLCVCVEPKFFFLLIVTGIGYTAFILSIINILSGTVKSVLVDPAYFDHIEVRPLKKIESGS